MITENEQIEFKKIIGAHYVDDVSEILMNKGIRNRNNGMPYSNSYIYKVFNGIRNNEDVEAAIVQLAAQKKLYAKNKKTKKQQVLNAS